MDFRDERGDRRPTPAITDERFYAVLQVNGRWKVDLTFWLHVVDRPYVGDAQRLREAPEEQRFTILRLKEACREANSTEIYSAVLHSCVRRRRNSTLTSRHGIEATTARPSSIRLVAGRLGRS